MKRVALALLAGVVLASGCGAKNKDETGGAEEDQQGATTEAATSADAASFGDLETPCGEGDYTVDPAEGGSADTLKIGVANDRTSQIRPGLNKEMWDASQAFAAWCNDQGGIGGLPIEIVDLDGKLLEVETAMATACNGVFMMVGGGYVQDNLEFTQKDGSDFHRCGLADIPGIAVAPEKSQSNGQVQPIPNPSSEGTAVWLHDFAELYPDQAAKMVEVWGELPALGAIKNQSVAIQDAVDGVDNVGVFAYPATGLSDWTPLAQQIIGTGATSMHFVGEPTNLGTLVKTLREQGWEGTPMVETNTYDQVYVDTAGAENAEGTVIRSLFHPLEEADEWPAVQQYIDITSENVDDAKIALLGMQSFSAWLLFATAANDCADSNDGELTRACVLEAAVDVDGWTAGGLHAPTDPGAEGGTPPECGMLLTVTEGGFERLFPEIGGDGDDVAGFHCIEGSNVEVPENEGLGIIGPDQPV